MSRIKLSAHASFQLIRQTINPRMGSLVRVCEANMEAFDRVIDDGLWLACGHDPALPTHDRCPL
jgi:hypothetical protein